MPAALPAASAMPKYTYTVQDPAGATSSGVLDAPDQENAVTTLQRRGLLVLTIQSEAAQGGIGKLRRGRGSVSGRELVFFGAQLSTLLNGGVPLVRSISLMADNSENPTLAEALHAITKDVAAGMQFYQAMQKQGHVFNNLWISLIQAGEMSGQLPRSLKQIAEYMEAQEEMKMKIITALMYPAILFIISMGVLVFFIIKIVPTFADIFDSFNLDLPPLTLLVVKMSRLLTQQLIPTIAVLVGAYYGARTYLKTDAGAMAYAKGLVSMPVLGNFMSNILLERLLTTLTALLRSGVTILNSLAVLEAVFKDNPMYVKAIGSVRQDVAQGRPVSSAFKKTGLLPNIATEMMMMGEEAGKLPEILETLANFYRSQVDSFVKRFSSIIDPILVVGIGGIVAVIVLSIFQPIFKLSQVGAKGGGG